MEIDEQDGDRLGLKDGRKWLDRLARAQKRQEAWLKDAERAEAIYVGEDPTQRVNIVFSNVETIVPALYNSTAIPDIRPRAGRGAEDTPSYRASQVIESAILYQTDDGVFDFAVEQAAQCAFVSGRGVLRVKLELARTGEPEVIYESVNYKDFLMGGARMWRDVPWVAFRHGFSEDQLEDFADEEVAEILGSGRVPDITWLSGACDDEDEAEVWEIWDKSAREVLFVNESGVVVKRTPDPLELYDFFPIAPPIQPITKLGKLDAVCPLKLYQTLNNDLQDISRRIGVLTKACRAVGLLAGNAQTVIDLADVEDGQLLVVEDIEGAALKGLDGVISYWPVEKVVAVLRELYGARDQTKAQIYEITGISDIVRGQSNASETATAQDIKSRWGSLRIRKLQTQIERAASELFKITAELVCSKFDPETLTRIFGQEIEPEALELLTQPFDHFRIDVETNSTVRNDQTLLQNEMSSFLQGTAQYFQTMTPIMSQPDFAAAIAPVIKLYGAFARTFNLGRQADDAIEEVLAVIAQADPREQAQQQQQQAEQQAEEAKQLAIEQYKAEHALKVQELELKAREVAVKEAQVGIKTDELQLKERTAEIDAAATLAEIDMEAEQRRPVSFNEVSMD